MSEDARTEMLESVEKLKKDLRAAAATLSEAEVRFLVDAYYTMQKDRIRAGNQVRALDVSGEPHIVLSWLGQQSDTLENEIRKALDVYTTNRPEGVWARSIIGVGPVITAGLLSHIDIKRAPTVGHIWSFAGLNPEQKWNTGEKRPWNARLKVVCWKLGESFKKVSGNENDVYGKLYRQRKEFEVARNERGENAAVAAETLKTKRFGDNATRTWYEAGKLPPGRLDLRATRWAVKLFLSAFHECLYFTEFKTLPPKPYILTKPEHVHYIEPPNMELIPGWLEARRALK